MNLQKNLIWILLAAFLLVFPLQSVSSSAASPKPRAPLFQCKVADAKNDLPIQGATVLLWDITNFRVRVGFTNSEGECNVTGFDITRDYTFYAYRGSLTSMNFDYVPQKKPKVLIREGEATQNVTFRLVPGASIYLDGDIYSVEAASPPSRVFIKAINPTTGSPYSLSASYISEYGDTKDQYYLNFTTEKLRRLAIVPADMPVSLEVTAKFYSQIPLFPGRTYFSTTFTVDNEGSYFDLSQGTNVTHTVTMYGLIRSFGVVNAKITSVFNEVNEAQLIGFYVAEERRNLFKAQSKISEAQERLNAKEYIECWSDLRVAYGEAEGVSKTLKKMRIISTSSAVYLPAIFAVFSVILAFFAFENNRKKLISSMLFYVAFLIALYFIYPGSRLIIEQNLLLFLGTAILSIFAALVVVFFVPPRWRGLEIEGQVTLKSFAPIIFSMAKRQIKRRKLRGFFTITSVIILVLAFTSLTSFGAVYGITKEKVGTIPAAVSGILLKRPGNETPFTPLSPDELRILPSLLKIENASPKVENLPDINPVARIVTVSKRNMTIYGILGVSSNETYFTHLDTGGYPNKGEDAILVSVEAKEELGLSLNERVQFYVYGSSIPIANFTVKGFFDDEEYAQAVDLDGRPFGPLQIVGNETVACNSTDVVIMNWQVALELQRKADALPTVAPQLAVLSRVAFQLPKTENLDEAIRMLTFVYTYDAYVSDNGRVTHHYLGFYYEAKGVAEILIPLTMVGLNVGAVMLNAVYERRREMEVMTVIGLNPVHLAFLFIAETIVIGMVAGGLGYLFGLGFYRIMSLFGQSLMVREKLEWWWSAIGFILAIVASVLSAARPAMIAVRKYTPAMIRKIKLPEKERRMREREIFKVYYGKKVTMPLKVHESEAPFFFGYIVSQIRDLKTRVTERAEEVEETEKTTPRGKKVKEIRFNYVYVEAGKRTGTENQLICTKDPKEDSYRIKLVCGPAEPGTPEEFIDKTIDVIRGILMGWVKEKKSIMETSRRIDFK